MEKLCLFCKSFEFYSAVDDWSDVTPISCKLGIFTVDLYEDTTETYRNKMLTAKNCVHYQQIEVDR